jgi:two-component system response regulator DevR
MTTRVFLIDDHELVRQAVSDLLRGQEDIELVGDAATATEGLAGVARTHPDVVVVDVSLPDGNGIEVCREIGSRYEGVRCLVLTAMDDEHTVFESVLAGAAGYVVKNAPVGDIVHAVRRIGGGHSVIDPEIARKALQQMRNAKRAPAGIDRLTERERLILELITEGLTNREIAQRLFLAEQTVKNHVSNLLNKLGMQRRTQAAVYASKLDRRDHLDRD